MEKGKWVLCLRIDSADVANTTLGCGMGTYLNPSATGATASVGCNAIVSALLNAGVDTGPDVDAGYEDMLNSVVSPPDKTGKREVLC